MKKLINNIYNLSKDMSRRNTASYAASVAFFFFMSFIPTIMFLFSIVRFLPITAQEVTHYLSEIVPDVLMDTVQKFIYNIYNSSLSLIPITLIGVLWSANMGMMGMIRALNGILDLEDKRNYIVLRLVATVYTVFLLLGLIISLILLGFGKSIVNAIVGRFPDLQILLRDVLVIRFLVIFIILALLFTLIYTFLPARRQSFLKCIPGAVFASLGWILVSMGLSIYIRVFNGFSVYGNLTAFMLLLFWLYLCFNLLMIGAFLNKYYEGAISRIVKRR